MSTPSSSAETVPSRVAELMPALLDDLSNLIAIPSVAFPGFPEEPVHRMGAAVVELLQRSGATDARLLPIPGGYPAVWAEIPAPEGAPTVTLYAHYDVQPAPKEQGWDTEPFVATRGPDGRIYGRGMASHASCGWLRSELRPDRRPAEDLHSVCPGGRRWPGAGSNRRPSAIQVSESR